MLMVGLAITTGPVVVLSPVGGDQLKKMVLLPMVELPCVGDAWKMVEDPLQMLWVEPPEKVTMGDSYQFTKTVSVVLGPLLLNAVQYSVMVGYVAGLEKEMVTTDDVLLPIIWAMPELLLHQL